MDRLPRPVDRRTVLQWSAAALAISLPGCATRPLPWPEDSEGPAKFVDVHCHIFSGKDVPASKFVLHVVAREMGFEEYAELAAFFVRLVVFFAPSAERERRKLTSRHLLVSVLPDAERDADFEEFVFRTLQQLRARTPRTPGGVIRALSDEEILGDLERAGWPQDRVGALRDTPLDLDTRALRTLTDTYLGPGRARILSIEPLTDADLRSIAEQLVALSRLASSDSLSPSARSGMPTRGEEIGSYLNFARAFLCFRSTNLRELDRQLRLRGPNRLACLYTPALIDYDWWFDAEDDTTPLLEQVKLMALISKNTEGGVLMNGFVPFDPLRIALERHATNSSLTFEIVKEAVRTHGFIGTKLYPPMGFQAAGNKYLETFGSEVDAFLKDRGIRPQDFGQELDDALDDFFDFCLSEDVPILTHSAASQTGFKTAGYRAAPEYWGTRLQSTSPKLNKPYKDLRVNLGHFGGAWCFSGERPSSDDEKERCHFVKSADWPKRIVELCDKYPNVYFDFADVGILSKKKGEWMDLPGYLRRTMGDISQKVLGRLLYGTDWMFLPVAAAGTYTRFAVGINEFSVDFQVLPDQIFWKNARNFLGLTDGTKTAARLKGFYQGDAERLRLLNELKMV